MRYTRKTLLEDRDGYAAETHTDEKNRTVLFVLTRYGIFVVEEGRWNDFIKTPNDFESKKTVSLRAFNNLKEWDRWRKRHTTQPLTEDRCHSTKTLRTGNSRPC